MAPASATAGTAAPAKLVEAARELLGERQPGDITVRDIAGRAGVQHSLITRHFGSRQAVLALAMATVFADVAAAIDEAVDLDAAIVAGIENFVSSPSLASAVGVLVSQGVAPAIDRYPIIEAFERQLHGVGLSGDTARETAVAVTVTISGWVAAEPWWLQITGHRDDPAAGRRVLERAVRTLVGGATQASPA